MINGTNTSLNLRDKDAGASGLFDLLLSKVTEELGLHDDRLFWKGALA